MIATDFMNDTRLWANASKDEQIFQHNGSDFFINYGIKVSRDRDTGELTLKNTRIGGDFYGPITYIQESWMRIYGFEIGARLISMHTLMQWVKATNKSIQISKNATTIEKHKTRRTSLLQEIRNHHEKINAMGRRVLDNEASENLQKIIVGIFNNEFAFSVSDSDLGDIG